MTLKRGPGRPPVTYDVQIEAVICVSLEDEYAIERWERAWLILDKIEKEMAAQEQADVILEEGEKEIA